MYVKRNYSFWTTFKWSKLPFIVGFIYASLIVIIQYFISFDISLPWQPISVVGIAVAFYLGFKNDSSYDRTWEARKIWGAIVNNSRSFAASSIAFVQGENEDNIKKELIYRHIAWITALRHQLRLKKEWEHGEDRVKGLYAPTVSEDYYNELDKELAVFIDKDELLDYHNSSNIATQILAKQVKRLQEIKDEGYFNDFRHMRLNDLMTASYDDQGMAERIKNFPFPRQYASTALWVTVVFCLMIPFGILNIFHGNEGIGLIVIPTLSALLIWIFFLMEMIGDYSENPFEGSYNDVPITSIARTIEIDLREMINDKNIPKPLEPENGFLL